MQICMAMVKRTYTHHKAVKLVKATIYLLLFQ